MPLMQCTKDGKTGLKWGESGTCYVGRGHKAKAERQGRAIEASKAQHTDSVTEPESLDKDQAGEQ